MNDLEPWKIWVVTGALVALILAGTAARVRPLSGGSGVAQANALTPGQRADSSAAGSHSETDVRDAYSCGFSQGYVSCGPIQDVSLRYRYPVSGRNSAFNDDNQESQLDVAKQIFGGETPQTVEDVSDSTANIASQVATWFPTDSRALAAIADDGGIAWTYPLTTSDSVELGWHDGLNTAIDDPDFFDPHPQAISNVDVINIRAAQIESEMANENGPIRIGWTESILNDATDLGSLLGSTSSGRIPIEVVPQLIELSEAGVDTYYTKALDAIRTKVIDVAIQQQVLDQVKAAQEEQIAFLQASAAYTTTIEQSYDDFSRIPW